MVLIFPVSSISSVPVLGYAESYFIEIEQICLCQLCVYGVYGFSQT